MRFRRRYSRVLKRFALFPIKAKIDLYSNIEEWRWLEVVYVKQTTEWVFGGIIPVWKNASFTSKAIYENYIDEKKPENEQWN